LLKTLHRSVFRALEPSKPSKSAIASVKKFTRQLITLIARYFLKEIPHNARGPLAGEFQPLAACKNLDYLPGNLRFLQFAIDLNSLRY